MNDLARRIAETIRAEGPISLERYWNLALFDADGGYYSRRDPFGRGGDFVTAPEVSQMFGELVGAWAVAAWRALGRPDPFVFAELGPGRGTLIADMLRAMRTLDAACLKAARVRLVETSDRLALQQLAALERFDLPVVRLRRIEECEPLPLVFVANELFDAIAIRQFVHDGAIWRERRVCVGDGGRFSTVLCDGVTATTRLPGYLDLPEPSAGAVFEVSPAREALGRSIGGHLARSGGAGLIFDYGHAESAYGETLQAIHGHASADPFDRPGECDITSHVDFARLGAQFARVGAVPAALSPQGEFLMRLGLAERAEVLGRGRDADARAAIEADKRRLSGCGDGEMGRLFKVLGVASRPLPLPPFA